MSVQAFFVNQFLRVAFRPRPGVPLNVALARKKMAQIARLNPGVPGDVAHAPVAADAGAGLCAAEWLRHAQPQRTVLYLHGGGYFFCNLDTHRPVCAYLARAAQAQVLSVDYRLAPEHAFPAAVDDALAWYAALLQRGVKPSNIVVAGDSAGGGLAVACLLAARERGLQMPAAALLFSPWMDLTCSGETMRTLAEFDVMFRPELLPQAAALYAGEAQLRHPWVSPVFADLQGLPPMLIHASRHEILLSDSTRLHERAQACGVRSELLLRDKLPHVWPTMVMLPEARESLKISARFMAQHTR